MRTQVWSILVLSVMVLACKPIKNNNEETADYSKLPNSILIVYASGQPFKTLSDVSPNEIDGITGATPKDMNVKIIAFRLADKLKAKKIDAKVLHANEIKNYREFLRYDMVIIGTPAYFWNIQYEIKQMLDVHWEKIYVKEKENFRKMNFMAFAMAEYDKSAELAISQINYAIIDCSAKMDTSMVFLAKKNMPEYEAQIEKFANQADSIMHLANNTR